MSELSPRLQARFDELRARLPTEEQGARHQSLEQFLQDGFPHKRLEAWRYTDLSALNDVDWQLAGPPDTAPELDRARIHGACRQVFVNGFYAAHLSDDIDSPSLNASAAPAATASTGSVSALNNAFATAGIQLKLGQNETLDTPLHVLSWQSGSAESMSHLRHQLTLGSGSEATVVMDSHGPGGLCTHHLDGELADNARLTLYCLQHNGADAKHLSQINLQVASGAQLKVVTVDCGDGLARRDLRVQLLGADAHAQLAGAYALSDRSHLDNQASIEHLQPQACGRQIWRGVLDGRAKAVLNSRVLMAKDAQKSDSEQSLAHLLLCAGPEVNAKPELEIYADDVKAGHGATVGQLDRTALHYLRSRGLDEQTARNLLIYTFVCEALDQIEHDAVRERADTLLRSRLPGLDLLQASL